MKFIQYENREEASQKLAESIIEQLNQSLLKANKVSLALPGGETPKALYCCLSTMDFAWEQVNITLTDERLVPVDHVRSNAGLLKSMLLGDKIPETSFYPINCEHECQQQQLMINTHFHPLDVCVLGMGSDGHTASLFPGEQILLNSQMDQNLDFSQPPGDLEPRITLTAKALVAAKYKHILIFGEEKLDVFKKAKQDIDITEMPIRLILQHPSDNVEIHYAP